MTKVYTCEKIKVAKTDIDVAKMELTKDISISWLTIN